MAGHDSPRQIAHKLRRTERAVRFRLAAQGLSGSVKDGISLPVFAQMFHIGHRKASALIANGILKVRDSRISSSSLAQFCTKHEAFLEPATVNRIKGELQKPAIGFSWERAASLVGISVDQLRALVAQGQLRVVDAFVTDKAFEEFCRNCGRNDAPQVNLPLMRPEILEWLVKDYGFVSPSAASSQSAPRAVKHALVVRVCATCKKEIRGNVYFAHIKTCAAALVVGR